MMEEQYRQAVEALAGEVGADELAEWHGTLTGVLCAAPRETLAGRIAALGVPGETAVPPSAGEAAGEPGEPEPETPLQRRLRADAQRVTAVTEQALASEELVFQPLLPEEAALTERALALGAWCQGFLFGLASTLPDVTARLGGEALEAVNDFGELALAVRGGEDADEVENAWVELVEFVRIGVLLVYEDLRGVRQGGDAAAAGSTADGHDDGA